ncbi:MAG: branched-chain amino acid aminotransferase, partial [Bacteroidota bacterium]
PFGRTFSDHMFTADYRDGQWTNFQIIPFGNFEIHPACMALHYGQAIFEGMKASKDIHGNPMLFRPEMHAQRINASAKRLCMPEFPGDVFVDALHKLVRLDSGWIPTQEGSALYIRPFMFSNGEYIGVAPSDQYKIIIFTGPVGPYYPKPVRLIAEDHYVRAAHGGVGEAKAAGNYGASLLPAKLAKEKGYDQVMWLDAKEFKYIQEAGTMNLFFVIDGKVVTPATDGAVLKGITRNSFLHILKDKGYTVEERNITIDELIAADKAGQLQEAFGAGTAAVVAHVADITIGDYEIKLPPVENRTVGNFLKAELNGLRAGTVVDTRGWVIPVQELEGINVAS